MRALSLKMGENPEKEAVFAIAYCMTEKRKEWYDENKQNKNFKAGIYGIGVCLDDLFCKCAERGGKNEKEKHCGAQL